MYRWSVAIVTGRGHVAGSRMRLSKKVLALRDQISVKSRDANTATLLYETQYGSQALYPHLLVSACLQPYTVGATGDKNSASVPGEFVGESIFSPNERPPIEEGLEDGHQGGRTFLKVFFQDYYRLLGLPR